jgi:flagellum-specific ATP synthase
MRWRGQVTQVIGQMVESEGPFCSVGEQCEIVTAEGRRFAGEIVGFRGATVLSMPLNNPTGIRFGDSVVTWGARPALPVGDNLLGRVIDGAGVPLDSLGTCLPRARRLLDVAAPLPLERSLIHEAIGCGIRAVDGFLTCGRGQRVGIFSEAAGLAKARYLA